MVPISAVIITRNEAGNISRCIESVVRIADEVLVVDSGSTDNTVSIAEKSGARVLHQEWLGYGKQKQFAVDQASYEWVLCLDADEWLSDELRAQLLEEKQNPSHKSCKIPRRNRFLGRWLKHGEGYPDYSLRFFDRRVARWNNHPVHESVESNEAVKFLKGDLLHDSAVDLKNYLNKQNDYTSLQAKVMFENGNSFSIWKMCFSPVLRFLKFYFFRLGFLDGIPGLIHISIGCWNSGVKHAKLFALIRQKNHH